MSDDVFSCPFCGGEAHEAGRVNQNSVRCSKCSASISQSEIGMGDAVVRWNTRTALAAASAQQPWKYIPPAQERIQALELEVRQLTEQAAVLRRGLELAIKQNSHDMLMTGEELRKCEAALAAHTPDRQQALRWLTQKERDSMGHRAEGMDGNEWDQWVQEKFAQVNGLKVQGGSYE